MQELFNFISGLFVVLGVVFIILLAITYQLVNSKQTRENQKAAWKRLAETYNLRFNSDNNLFGIGAEVTGNYKGYLLKLDSFKYNNGRGDILYTRVTVTVPQQCNHLSAEQPKPPLSFQDALNRFNLLSLQYKIEGEVKTLPGGRTIYYDQPGIMKDAPYLAQLFDHLISLAEAYPILVSWGGEAILPLQQIASKNHVLRPIITWLLQDIAQNSSEQLAENASYLLCPTCLTRFGPRQVWLSWLRSCTYYGCRTCGQSREFLEGPVIAVLDKQMTAGPTRQEGFVRINWSARRELFDFDAIEVVHATDEEVERFAIQVGNDTDPTRESRYRNMQCVILPGCQLSENTIRILQRTFKVVMANEAAHWTEKESGMNSELLNNAQ